MLNGIHKSNKSSGTPRLHTVGRPSVWAWFYGQRRRARVTGDLEGRGGISTFLPSVIREEARKQCENKIECKSMWELQSQSQIKDTIDWSDSMFVVYKRQPIFFSHLFILGTPEKNIYFTTCFSATSRRRYNSHQQGFSAVKNVINIRCDSAARWPSDRVNTAT